MPCVGQGERPLSSRRHVLPFIEAVLPMTAAMLLCMNAMLTFMDDMLPFMEAVLLLWEAVLTGAVGARRAHAQHRVVRPVSAYTRASMLAIRAHPCSPYTHASTEMRVLR
eukprot:3376158-Rhodomonas_salina.2